MKLLTDYASARLNTRTPIGGRGINEEDVADIAQGRPQLSALVFQDAHERSHIQVDILFPPHTRANLNLLTDRAHNDIRPDAERDSFREDKKQFCGDNTFCAAGAHYFILLYEH